MRFDDLVEAATQEIRRQAPRTEEVGHGHVTIPRAVDLDVNEIVEAVLGELWGGFGSIGEVKK